jgi:hypothetical protein
VAPGAMLPLSNEPSFMTMTSTSSTPGILRGIPAITCAIVFSSFNAGMVTTSFMPMDSPKDAGEGGTVAEASFRDK